MGECARVVQLVLKPYVTPAAGTPLACHARQQEEDEEGVSRSWLLLVWVFPRHGALLRSVVFPLCFVEFVLRLSRLAQSSSSSLNLLYSSYPPTSSSSLPPVPHDALLGGCLFARQQCMQDGGRKRFCCLPRLWVTSPSLAFGKNLQIVCLQLLFLFFALASARFACIQVCLCSHLLHLDTGSLQARHVRTGGRTRKS